MSKWDEISDEKFYECASRGLNNREISSELGVPFSTLKKIIVKRELRSEMNFLRKQYKNNNHINENNEILSLYLKGVPIEKISIIMRLSENRMAETLNYFVTNETIKASLCEYCNEVNDYSYATGRFCSINCSSKYSHSNVGDDYIEKRNGGLRKGRNTQSNKWAEYNESLKSEKPLEMPYKRATSSIFWTAEKRLKQSIMMKNLWNDEEFRRIGTLRNQNVSDETKLKLSNARKKAIADGRVIPWGTHSGESYPEKYFAEVLNNNNIPFEKQYKIVKGDYVEGESGSYFLDFYIEINEVKIDLEIDGSHHWLYDGAIERDEIRNSFMESIGYEVYRIKWCSPNKNRGIDIQEKIDELLKFLESFEK